MRGVSSRVALWWVLLVVAAVTACGDNLKPSDDKVITSFSFSAAANPSLTEDTTATISGTSISVRVPHGADVRALVATFDTKAAHVTVGGKEQVSGVTANDYTAPVEFLLEADDGSTTMYTVTVSVEGSSAKEITSFAFNVANNPQLANNVTAIVNGSEIVATVPYGTNVTALVATFTTTGVNASVGTTSQTSNVTANDFTNPVSYTVSAEDGSTKVFVVTVTVAPSTAKELTMFKLTAALNGQLANDVVATINGTAIAATVPYGTDVSALVATFSTTGTSVAVGATTQVSGSTPNDFTSPVSYVVSAADGSTTTYIVTVTIALNTAKELTSFKFTSALNGSAGITTDVIATINGNAITATVPYGTTVSALIATFSTTGDSVSVGGVIQTSGVTANNFSGNVVYTVAAADASTKDFTVAVTVAQNPAKDMTAFSFTTATNSQAHLPVDAVGTITGQQVAITVRKGTDLTVLAATFSITGASVSVGATPQTSGITQNDFTNPVTYTVKAADGTTKDYTVTVSVFDPAVCATNPQWTPVTCTTTTWVWTTNRAIATTVATASTNHVLASYTGDEDGFCSLDGTGWVSVDTFIISGCNTSWAHIQTNTSFNCGGWDGQTARHLSAGPNDCYAY